MKLEVDLSRLVHGTQRLTETVMGRIEQVVIAVADQAAYQWKDRVAKARIWQGEKTPYIASISWERVGPCAINVKSDYALAREIEDGRPARDLKLMIAKSKKARQNSKGTKYLIIPFRHNVPTPSGEGALARQMPPSIYAMAKGLTPSRVLPLGSLKPATRLSASGFLVPQQSYKWGGRLPAGLAPKLRPEHVTDIYAGMVRFDTSTSKSKSSTYLTFRTMSEKSPGWIVRARPGLHIARGVTDNLAPIFQDLIKEAIRRG